MPISFQPNLPKEATVGKWIKIDYTCFGPIIIYIEEIQPDKLVGFNLLSCKQISLRLGTDGTVYNKENWSPWMFDILSPAEVLRHAVKQQEELDAGIERMSGGLEAAKAASARYRKEIPGVLKKLASEAVNV